MLHRFVSFSAALCLLAAPAFAGPNWHAINLSVAPGDAPAVQAAFAKMMGSAGGNLGSGSVSLMGNVAGGDGTHVVISSFESRAAREAWVETLFASDAWTAYAKATAGKTTGAGASRFDFVADWGTDNEGADVFWELHALRVSDEGALQAALDALQNSDVMKAAGTQVYLSRLAAAGLSKATHIVSVGFQSEAHAEKANAARVASDAWAAFQEATDGVSSYLGGFMLRTLQTYGDGS